MKKIGLSVYMINVHSKNTKQKYININEIYNNKSFVDIVEEFLNEMKGAYDRDDESENIFTTVKTDRTDKKDKDGRPDYKCIFGQIKTGDYGTASELVDSRTGKVSHNKTSNEAEVIPFVFGMLIPAGDRDNGIIIFQTEGRFGMKSSFEKRLRKYILEKYPDIDFNMGALLPTEYIEKVMKRGVLEKIKLICFQAPLDTRKALSVNEGIEIKEERIYYGPTGFIGKKKDAILGFLHGKNGLKEIIADENFIYDEMKMEFKIGNRKRTFNLNNISKIVPIIDITKEMEGRGDHPEYALVKSEIRKNALEFLEEVRTS